VTSSADRVRARAGDLLQAAHGIAAAGTAAEAEQALPALVSSIEESLALLAISASALGDEELADALRAARRASERRVAA
jgi:predicted dinucleotide-utilizing enzyme